MSNIQKSFQLIIIGGGPAGLTASIYAAREGIQAVVLEKALLGGQVATTDKIDNYPGFPQGIKGPDFAQNLVDQAKRFNAEIVENVEVQSLENLLFHLNRNKDNLLFFPLLVHQIE